MKALTLTQPWASLVARGHKRVETRSWGTNYRGPLAIHAAKGMDAVARDFASCRRVVALLGSEPLPRGMVLAIGDLVACNLTESVRHGFSKQEIDFGDYSDGRFAWSLSDVVPLEDGPVAARGALGLWDWNPPPRR